MSLRPKVQKQLVMPILTNYTLFGLVVNLEPDFGFLIFKTPISTVRNLVISEYFDMLFIIVISTEARSGC